LEETAEDPETSLHCVEWLEPVEVEKFVAKKETEEGLHHKSHEASFDAIDQMYRGHFFGKNSCNRHIINIKLNFQLFSF